MTKKSTTKRQWREDRMKRRKKKRFSSAYQKRKQEVHLIDSLEPTCVCVCKTSLNICVNSRLRKVAMMKNQHNTNKTHEYNVLMILRTLLNQFERPYDL